MESRFRRFISAKREPKREKPELQAVDVDLQSSLYRALSLQWSLPDPEPRPQSQSKQHDDDRPVAEEDLSELQAISYDAVAAGKAPTFGFDTIKGNGPIKLQTSRRLSSGEVATDSDMQSILDDIKEGDYLVGRKNLHDSRAPSTRRTRPPKKPVWSNRESFVAEAFQSPRPAPRTPTSPVSLSPTESSEDYHPFTQSVQEKVVASSPSVSSCSSYNQHHPKSPAIRRASQFSNTSSATSPSIHAEEQNAIVTALWKAEYNRLVDMCGLDHVERTMPQMSAGGTQAGMWSTPHKNNTRISEADSEPSPQPNTENVEKVETPAKRLSKISTISACNEDSSDAASNPRTSLVSSSAASSSCTMHTSYTDHDAVVTRDEIRKIVNDMRSRYLQALDAETPVSPKPVVQTPKRKQRNKLGTSTRRPPASGKSLTGAERKTWHGNASAANETLLDDGSKIRSASNPGVTFGRLSPIEASPPPRSPKRPTYHLQRADSTTLGNMVAKFSNDSDSSTATAASPPRLAQEQAPPVTPRRTSPSSDHCVFDAQPGTTPKTASPTVPHNEPYWQRPAVKPVGNFF